MLNLPDPRSRILTTTLYGREADMPHYEFFCHACKQTFSKVLTLAEYEQGEIICTQCGSTDVEQSWSAFHA
jgi:putative FmdB family regulatory protein